MTARQWKKRLRKHILEISLRVRIRSPFDSSKLWLLIDSRFLGFRFLKWWVRVHRADEMLFSDRQRGPLVRWRGWVVMAC